MARSIRLALVLAPVLASPALATTWTVDDDGPAQFTTIDDAHAAAQPGDVILVAPGTYPAFHLTKRIAVLGPALGTKPTVLGTSSVQGAPAFTLAGLSLQQLQISDVAGRARIDECTLTSASGEHVVSVTNCAQLVVMRTTISGNSPGFYDLGSSAAFRATASTIELVGCSVAGGGGAGGAGWDGQSGLSFDQCEVWVTRTSAWGGNGGAGGLFGSSGGKGGYGLRAANSTVRVRGFDNDVLHGGVNYSGGGSNGGLAAQGGAQVVVSGIPTPTLASPSFGQLTVLATPSPTLELLGDDGPGDSRRLQLRGPVGAVAFVGLSAAPALFALPGIEGALWIDPLELISTFAMTTQGQGQVVSKPFQVPPLVGLEGLALGFQAVFPALPGEFVPQDWFLSNSAELVLRF